MSVCKYPPVFRFPACLAGLLALFLAFPLSAALAAEGEGFPESKIFNKVWKDLSSVSDKAVELAVQEDSKKKTFFENLTSSQPKYVRLLKKAQDILGRTEASELFDKINKLQSKNIDLSHETSSLKRERYTAPAESMNPLAKTKKRIDKRLEEIATEIEENRNSISQLQNEICNLLGQSGMSLTIDEVNYFVISAEGDELFHLMMIANNMKKMQQAIESILSEDRNNLDLARTYTGMYMISLDAYATAHEMVMENIGTYRQRLVSIKDGASQNLREAQTLRRRARGSDAGNLDANIKINEQTIATANMYDQLLERRLRNLAQSRQALKLKVEMAQNTYKTISNGSSLISLVNSASNDYSLLTDFEMPELKSIYDSALLSAFVDISEKIKLEK